MDERASTSASEAWMATIGAALARRGRPLKALAVGLGVAAIALGVALLLMRPERHGAAVLLSCVAQLGLAAFAIYLGQRIALDADLFEALARKPDPAGFDAAMVDLGLIAPAGAPRSMQDRVAGLKRLLSKQAGVIGVQMVLFAVLLVGGLA